MTKKTRQHRRRRRRRRRKENTKERKGARRKRAEGSAPTDDVSTIYKYVHIPLTYKRRRVLRNSSLGGLKTRGACKETHLKFQIRNSWVDLQTQNAFFDEQRWSSSPPPLGLFQ